MKHIFLSCMIGLILSVSPASAQNNEQLLGSIGTFTTVTVYNTYLIVGLIMDAHASGVYEAEVAGDLLAEQQGLMGEAGDRLEQLLRFGELKDPNDVRVIQDILSICKSLKSMSLTAARLVNAGYTDEGAEIYEAQREDTWGRIAALMGLE